MKTHPESIFVNYVDLLEARAEGANGASHIAHLERYKLNTDVEFVPVSALVDIWSAGYVAGQKAVTEGPQRNPYARIDGT